MKKQYDKNFINFMNKSFNNNWENELNSNQIEYIEYIYDEIQINKQLAKDPNYLWRVIDLASTITAGMFKVQTDKLQETLDETVKKYKKSKRQ